MQICKCRHFCHSVIDKHIFTYNNWALNYQLCINSNCIYNPLCLCPLSLNAWYLSLSLSLSPKALISLHLPTLHLPFCFAVIHCSVLHISWFPSPLFLYISLSLSLSFPISLTFSWLNVAQNKFQKAGESAPLGISCTFRFVERKFLKRDSENRAKKIARGRERRKMRNQAKIKFKANRPRRVLAEHLSHFVCLTHE